MNTRVALRVVPVIALAVGGLWAYASHDMDSRIQAVRSEIAEQTIMRNGSLPSADFVSERALRIAGEHGVTLDDVNVALDENASPDGAGRAALEVMGPLQLTLRYTGYEVTARARAQRWIFSRDEPFRVRFSMRREASASPTPRGREPSQQEFEAGEPQTPRGM